MKVGILTYHWVANFGANLQALSTYNYLLKNNCDPIVINWIPKDWDKVNKNIVDKTGQINEHKKFCESYLKTSQRCLTNNDITQVVRNEKLDVVLIGSDAVFFYLPFADRFCFPRRYGIKYMRYITPLMHQTARCPFWGDFIKNTNAKIAVISASAQNCNYPKISSFFEAKLLRKKLTNFTKMYVRDIWTQEMFQTISQQKLQPKISPDPVFAFNQNAIQDYISPEQLRQKHDLPEKYILISVSTKVFSQDWIAELEQICKKKGFTLIELPRATHESNIKIGHRIHKPLSPIDWYYLIKFSSGYIGELMHPIIVSLHNSVPVYSIDTYGFQEEGRLIEKSSKIYQILSRFDLLDHYYHKNYSDCLPTSQQVFDKIISFDEKKCTKNALQMYEAYCSMMTDSLHVE